MTKKFRASVKTNTDQLDALGLGFEQQNVIYNSAALAVTPNAGMVLDYAASLAGQVNVRGTVQAAIAASTVTIATADATNPRIDVVQVDSSGTVAKTDGTAAADPAPPALAADEMALAYVYVAANDTVIGTADITDARIFQPWLEEYIQTEVPSWVTPAAAVGSGNTAYFQALEPLTRSVIATQVVLNLAVSSGNVDAGIYSWDGTDMTKVVTMGTTASPGTTTQKFNIADTQLNPGTRYFLAWAADNATVSITRMAATAPLVGSNGLGYSKGGSFPLPASVLAPTAVDTGPVGFVTISGGSVT